MADSGKQPSDRLDIVETAGGSIEEAVKRALLQLNATLDDVDIEVLDSGAPRLLRRRGGEARVRVSRRDHPFSTEESEPEAAGETSDDQADEVTPPPEQPAEQPAEEPAGDEAPAAPEPSEPRARGLLESGEELENVAEDVLAEMIDRMGFVADFELVSDDPLTYNIIGDDDFGALIGRQGETLRSFGYLLNLMIGRRLGRSCRVLVDVTGYRQRRAEQLAELAERLAGEVRESQEPVTLEAMPAGERRLVHIALAEDPDVRTYSIGEGDERRVVISPKA